MGKIKFFLYPLNIFGLIIMIFAIINFSYDFKVPAIAYD